jgi:hypothetical protein
MTAKDELKNYQDRIEAALKLDKLDKDRLKRLKSEYEALKKNNATIEEFRSFSEDINTIIDSVSDDLDYINKSFTDSVSQLSKGKNLLNAQKSALSKLSNIARETLNIRRGDSNLDDKKFKRLQEQARSQTDILRTTRDQLRTQGESVKAINQQIADTQLLEDGFKAILKVNEDVEKKLGFIPQLAEGIDKALSKIGLPELGFAEAVAETKRLAQEAAAAGIEFNAASTYVNVLTNNLADAFTPANLIQSAVLGIVDALFALDESTGNLAKNFGISYAEASGFSDELNSAANNAYLLNVNTQGLTDAFTTLNNEFGTFEKISTESLVSFQRLTKEAGLSNEAAIGLYRTSILTGGELENNTKEFMGEAKAIADANGLALNQKQILEEVKNVSSATLLTLGGQPKALANAIVKAKALGVSLEQVENISSSLLDFENSISAELEAELLTGKNLNLEKARLAALNGDLATVAEEIAKQTGSAADFTKMNVIQQEALAKSVGMTREDLAKSLMEREALAKLSGVEGKTAQEKFNNLVKEVGLEEAKKQLGDEQLANLLAGQSAQERFTAAIEKLKEVFVSIAEPLLPVLDVFGKIAETVAPLAGFIGQIVKHAMELGKYLLPVYGIYKGILLVQQGILLFQQRGLFQAKAAAVFNKLGLITDKQKLFYQSRLTYFENLTGTAKKKNLILENASIVNSLKKNTLAAIAVVHERMANIQKSIGVGIENAMVAIKNRGILATIKDLTLQGLARANKLKNMLIDVGSLAISSAKAVAGIPIIGPLLAAGAAVGGIALGLGLYNRFKGNDVVSPGYGKRTLLSPEGAIDLNNKDTVIAGTNLGGGSNQSANSSSPSINLSPLIERMSAVENLLSQILSKEGTVFLDGNKVGTAMAMGTYKTQ